MRITISAILLLLMFYVQTSGQSVNEIDSLTRALHAEKSDTGKILLLSEISFRYANSNPDTAMTFARQEVEIANRISIPRFTAFALNDVAIVLYYKGDYTEALINNKKALEIRRQLGDEALIISSLNKIAVIYQDMGNFETATQYQLEVLKLAEHINNEAYIGITLNNISLLLQKTGKYDQARAYNLKAIDIAIKNKDTLYLATAYSNMENVFEHSRHVDSAIFYQHMAIRLFEKINALSEVSHAYNDMGYLFRLQGKDDSGLYYYRKAMSTAIALGNTNDEGFFAANVGEVYITLKKPDSAYIYLRRAQILSVLHSSPEMLKTIYGGLATYYTLKDRHDSSIFYMGLYKAMLDTIYSATTAKQINELQTRYETEKKEQQITLLSEQNIVKQLSINRKNILIGIIAGSFLVAVILGALFYNRYRLKQEAKLQDEIMKQQRLASKSVIAAEELERQRIAGDLHDGIGQMFSAVKMNLSGIADRIQIPNIEDRHLLEKTLALVDESCKEVRVISHQMMPNVLLKAGLSSAIRDFIDKIDENKLKITLETFGLQQPLESNIESVLYRILQESVNNVIKHAKATRLDIQLHKDEESITVTIEDNGIGFDLAKISEKQGIGLNSIKARVEFLNGKVDYDTAPGKGTLIAIYIPDKA